MPLCETPTCVGGGNLGVDKGFCSTLFNLLKSVQHAHILHTTKLLLQLKEGRQNRGQVHLLCNITLYVYIVTPLHACT